jgi:transposase-like protein
VSGVELITRRRKWSPTQEAALLEEIEAEGGKVAAVARRHGISDSLLYNWRSAWKAAASEVSAAESVAVFRRLISRRAQRICRAWA